MSEETWDFNKLNADLVAARVEIDTLRAKLAERGLCGSLLLDYQTLRTAPMFFAIQALLFRAAGMKIVVVGAPGDEKLAAAANVSLNDFRLRPASWPEAGAAKFTEALSLLREGPVIWPDIDFARWGSNLPSVDHIKGLTILDWSRCAEMIRKGNLVGRA